MIISNYYEDPDTLHLGTEKVRAYYVPLSVNNGSRLIDLNGDDWMVQWFKNIFEVDDSIKNGILSNPDTIQVPSCLNILGYDNHHYSNLILPIPFDPPYVPTDNSCATYVKKVHIQKDSDELYYLNFDGVDSCFYLWINGHFVGYSQVSHATSEFNVSSFIQNGENTISVLVLKWCDGTYFEDQDKFRMTGIFRDVYILKRAKNHIKDFYIKTIMPGAENYLAQKKNSFFSRRVLFGQDNEYSNKPAIAINIQDIHGKIDSVEIEVFSPQNELLTTQKIVVDPLDYYQFTYYVDEPLLWSAETPYLYLVRLKTNDEIIEQKVGLRYIQIKDAILFVNGRSIKLKGVNRHDSDPYTGFSITKDQLIMDLKLMKKHNINAIRTSHYPNSPWAYDLYDEYGFYIIAEADIETHNTDHLYGGGRVNYNYDDQIIQDSTFGLLCSDPIYKKTILDRVERCVIREKNHPSIIMWSLGNESGYGPNMEEAAKYIHEIDKDFLVHYESSIYEMPDHQNDLSNLDVYSRMYMPVDKCEKYCLSDTAKPLVLCEYSCAMGNGPGDLEDYFAIIYDYDSFAGAFVWEWCDHAIYGGIAENGKKKFLFGGDSGELLHDGSFCVDGLVYPDRRPHTGLFEYKNVWRPIRMTESQDEKGESVLSFTNTMDFLSSNDILEIRWSLFLDHKKINEGVLHQNIQPRQTVDINLSDFPINNKVREDMYLIFRYVKTKSIRNISDLVPIGSELGIDQYILQKVYRRFNGSGPKSQILQNDDQKLIIRCKGSYKYTFDKLRGTLMDVQVDNESLFKKPMEYNIWRAPTDNDKRFLRFWKTVGYDRMKTKVYESSVSESETFTKITFRIGIGAVGIQNFMALNVKFLVHYNGSLSIIMDAQKNEIFPVLPRFGIRMFLANNFATADYIGLGPYESYTDKCRASYYGRFKTTISEMHEDYIVPQENGSHCDCNYLSISSPNYTMATVGDGFSFNVSYFTQEELERAKHNFELEESSYAVVCIDNKQNGIGSASCGPMLIDKYKLSETNLNFHQQFMFSKN
ncbi:MAG: hypothetical protein ATN31_07145 [Candidatus Epulonipiscioides saccharophilum]|nr:MAG: hypothetical protein ATN31_07145 [Epulopiscium sp. AS2M-Bin001]